MLRRAPPLLAVVPLLALPSACVAEHEPTAARELRLDDAPSSLPALPLSTSGRWIVDANGGRFKLASVNWYGAESPDHVVGGLDQQPLSQLAAQIRTLGFNSVRLPWSNELLEGDPPVDDARLAANPDLVGKSGMTVLDSVVDALAQQGLVVILSNHVSRADWCCSEDDGNGLWYTADVPESRWLDDWRTIVRRYAAQPAVVGADLRNEPRKANGVEPVWGGDDPTTDWAAAAERGGEAVLGENPNLLVIVEGVRWGVDLHDAIRRPIQLSQPARLVYSPHDYGYYHPTALLANFAALKQTLGFLWGYLINQDQSYTAPVWLGEFGTCHGSTEDCVDGSADQARWFNNLRRYLAEADFDWSYWALNGTQTTGTTRTLGAEEAYSVLDTSWAAPTGGGLVGALQSIEPATQGPSRRSE
jgi:endoglucanase